MRGNGARWFTGASQRKIMMFDYCVILAGGSGTRLWPLSNSGCPKQFLKAPGSNETFFTMALRRGFAVLNEGGKLLIVAAQNMTELVAAECTNLDAGQRERITILPEPAARNTACACACAAVYIKKMYTQKESAAVIILTSDHIITPQESFVRQASLVCAAIGGGGLGVFGIQPDRPETGYGYIETENTTGLIKKVLSFHEKPDTGTAQKYIQAGTYYWNSGMFAFNLDFILQQFYTHAPHLVSPFESLPPPSPGGLSRDSGTAVVRRWEGLAEAYAGMQSISFDYAIAEKCRTVFMAASDFFWADVGSWDEYAKLAGSGPASPAAPAPVVEPAETTGHAAVFSAGGGGSYVLSDIPVALCGVDDLVVVIQSGKNGRPPTALIAKKGTTQKVREIVDKIKTAGRTDLL